MTWEPTTRSGKTYHQSIKELNELIVELVDAVGCMLPDFIFFVEAIWVFPKIMVSPKHPLKNKGFPL